MVRSRSSNSKNKEDATAITGKDAPAPQRKARNSKVKAPVTPNSSKSKKNIPAAAVAANAGNKGGTKGKGAKKGKRTAAPKKQKPLTAEQLDQQMDDYMMRNEKTAEKVLEDQMDDYWARKGKTSEEAVAAADAETTADGDVN
jgi:C-terminal duplication domain of Friend of PRMT1